MRPPKESQEKSPHKAPDELVEAEVVPEDEADAGPAALRALREKLNACLSEKQEYLAGWQRAKADYVNARKAEGERAEHRANAERLRVLASVLAALDSFEMALGDRETWEKVDTAWRTGIERIYNQLTGVLAEHGVEPFGEIGEPFDPRHHEPVTTVPAVDAVADNTVARVIQRGYRAGESILRPARVTVFQVA